LLLLLLVWGGRDRTGREWEEAMADKWLEKMMVQWKSGVCGWMFRRDEMKTG